jgi:hypothetical protein
VLSQVLLKKEDSLETAAKVLQRVMLATHGHLSKVADGEEFFPRFHLQDPVLSADAGAAIGGATSGLPPLPKVEGTMFASGATFFNYAPCVLSESYTGAQASLTGLNFAPTLLQVSRSGRRRREIKRKERARQRSGKKEEKLTTPKKKLLKKYQLGAVGFTADAVPLTITPNLIYVQPLGAQVNPQGVNIQVRREKGSGFFY